MGEASIGNLVAALDWRLGELLDDCCRRLAARALAMSLMTSLFPAALLRFTQQIGHMVTTFFPSASS